MTDMVERAARAACNWQDADNWEFYIDLVRVTLEAAFKVTDEDAKAFFGEDEADIEWDVEAYDNDYDRSLSQAMQALSDAALKDE